MNMTSSTANTPATSEYVLRVLVDSHRQQCQWDDAADPDAKLTFSTTVDDWRDACDLLEWRQLGHALNEAWGLTHTDEEWRGVLEPADTRTLCDVCNFISRNATMPELRPIRILGKVCKPAATFLAIRSILQDAGADVSKIAPSTPIDEYARHHLLAFLGPISKLAPGALPPMKMHKPLYDVCVIGFGIGFLTMGVSFALCHWVPHLLAVAALGLAVGGVSYFGIGFTARRPPRRVEFGDIRTFRDLAIAIS